MAKAAVSCFQEEKRNIGFLERQIEECPAREERFIKRGVEYLCLRNIYDAKDSKLIGDLFRLRFVKDSYILCKKIRILRECTR